MTRELRRRFLAQRAMRTVDGEIAGVEHLPAELTGRSPWAEELGLAEDPKTAKDLVAAKKRVREAACGKIEAQFVRGALERAGWNVTRAAEAVGMQRTNFHGLMRKHGIRAGDKNRDKE